MCQYGEICRIPEHIRVHKGITQKYYIDTKDKKDFGKNNTLVNTNSIYTIKKELMKLNNSQEKLEQEKKEQEKEKRYTQLIEKLSKENPIEKIINKSTVSDEKVKEILSKLNKNNYTDSEDEGIAISINSINSKIYKEAQSKCNHDFEISFKNDLTSTIRKRVSRTIKCEKCHLLHEISIVEEKEPEWI